MFDSKSTNDSVYSPNIKLPSFVDVPLVLGHNYDHANAL